MPSRAKLRSSHGTKPRKTGNGPRRQEERENVRRSRNLFESVEEADRGGLNSVVPDLSVRTCVKKSRS